MRLTFKSRKFLNELRRRRGEFGAKAAARITVPDGPEYRWWYFQEFGTATHNPDSPNPAGYDILPVNGKGLAWTNPDGSRVVVPFVGFPHTRPHPGVIPRRFITDIEPTINRTVADRVAHSLTTSGFSFEALRSALLTDIMPNIKSQIVQSMAEKLPGTREDGKLAGQRAADVFDAISTTQES